MCCISTQVAYVLGNITAFRILICFESCIKHHDFMQNKRSCVTLSQSFPVSMLVENTLKCLISTFEQNTLNKATMTKRTLPFVLWFHRGKPSDIRLISLYGLETDTHRSMNSLKHKRSLLWWRKSLGSAGISFKKTWATSKGPCGDTELDEERNGPPFSRGRKWMLHALEATR